MRHPEYEFSFYVRPTGDLPTALITLFQDSIGRVVVKMTQSSFDLLRKEAAENKISFFSVRRRKVFNWENHY
jgi:hypothetical protein